MATPGLRIVAGEWRGRKIPPPPPGVNTRPTANAVKEALFNILAPWVPGARVLDAFAGTGSLGIEALSRGAAHVTFSEPEPRMQARLKDILRTLGAESRARVLSADIRRCLGRLVDEASQNAGLFDIILLDPPFLPGYYDWIVREPAWGKLLAPHGRMTLEHPAGLDPLVPLLGPDFPFTRLSLRRYGAVQVSILAFAKAGGEEQDGEKSSVVSGPRGAPADLAGDSAGWHPGDVPDTSLVAAPMSKA